jgi:hypothetical protein
MNQVVKYFYKSVHNTCLLTCDVTDRIVYGAMIGRAVERADPAIGRLNPGFTMDVSLWLLRKNKCAYVRTVLIQCSPTHSIPTHTGGVPVARGSAIG